MEADERAAALSLVGVVVGSILFGIGLLGHNGALVLLGLVMFPAGIMYGLVGGGYPSGEPRSHH